MTDSIVIESMNTWTTMTMLNEGKLNKNNVKKHLMKPRNKMFKSIKCKVKQSSHDIVVKSVLYYD